MTAEESSTMSARCSLVIVADDVVIRAAIEDRQPRQPLLNAANLSGDPRAGALGLTLQAIL